MSPTLLTNLIEMKYYENQNHVQEQVAMWQKDLQNFHKQLIQQNKTEFDRFFEKHKDKLDAMIPALKIEKELQQKIKKHGELAQKMNLHFSEYVSNQTERIKRQRSYAADSMLKKLIKEQLCEIYDFVEIDLTVKDTKQQYVCDFEENGFDDYYFDYTFAKMIDEIDNKNNIQFNSMFVDLYSVEKTKETIDEPIFILRKNFNNVQNSILIAERNEKKYVLCVVIVEIFGETFNYFCYIRTHKKSLITRFIDKWKAMF